MFVFYFGIAADLTPPVALAAYAGAGIAGSDPMKTGVTSFKLALAGFLVPYIYVYNPMLLFIDVEPFYMAQAICTALIGVFLLAMFTIGYFKAHLAWYMRRSHLPADTGHDVRPLRPRGSWRHLRHADREGEKARGLTGRAEKAISGLSPRKPALQKI